MRVEMSRSAARGIADRVRSFALNYAATPFHPQWFSFTGKRVAAKRAAAKAVSGTVLDIGCGNAAIKADLPPRCAYIGLDYPATGKVWYGAQPEVYGDARALPFRDGSINQVFLLDVLEHLAEPEQSLREAFRVLVAGGRLVINVPCVYPLHDEPHDYQRFTEHGLRHRLMGAGFIDIDVTPRGAPIETAALLFNIALAKCAVHMVRATPFALLVIWPLVFVVPLLNLVARAVGLATGQDHFMPYAYLVECAKPTEVTGSP